MLIGRFLFIIPMLAVAGSLAAKKTIPSTSGTLPTHGALFVGLLVGTVIIVGALTYFPALSLGPIVEHYLMHGGRLFSMGNGGSSCDASHVAVEFVHPITAGRPALSAINLVADLAMISAVGNDVGFDHIFVRQILAQGRAGDGLIGISTSGNSANLIAAFAKAKEIGIATIGLAGGDGGKMLASGVVDHCLIVPSTSIHRIQESHVTAYHIIWDLVHTLLADDRGAAAAAQASA